MGYDIHSFAEVKRNNKWEKVEDAIFPKYRDKKSTEPFSWRSYSMFAFLAGVRNYDHCEPISEPKGLPKDSEWLNKPTSNPEMRQYYTETPVKIETNYDDIANDYGYHSSSHLTLKELLDFDYNKTFWNRRVSYKEHLGEGFFEQIEVLKTLGKPEDVRIIFYFN